MIWFIPAAIGVAVGGYTAFKVTNTTASSVAEATKPVINVNANPTEAGIKTAFIGAGVAAVAIYAHQKLT